MVGGTRHATQGGRGNYQSYELVEPLTFGGGGAKGAKIVYSEGKIEGNRSLAGGPWPLGHGRD